MKTIDIKGKNYVEVNERIKHFRENFKDWSLQTELVSLESGVCVMKAIIRNPEGVVKATGYAYEKEGSSFINKTSYIENCETSAWGRALGNLGIGIDTSIASADEVQNAMLNQNKPVKEVDINNDTDVYIQLCTITDIDEMWAYYHEYKDKVKSKQKLYNQVQEQIKTLKKVVATKEEIPEDDIPF